MPDFLFNKSTKFTSVREPFWRDTFIAQRFKETSDASQAAELYIPSVLRRPLLRILLEETAAYGKEGFRVQVVDCGVFMGTFTINAHIHAENLSIPVEITAYEANASLIPAIRDNLILYGVEAEVQSYGIGGKYETVDFVHGETGLIGGTMINTEAKKRGGRPTTTIACDIVPLSSVLEDVFEPGIIKIDIEGNETAAFGSISGDANRMNNVFIVEFAPWQASKAVGAGIYADFLLDNYNVFDIVSWSHFPKAERLESSDALLAVVKANTAMRSNNTDLVLVPKAMKRLSHRIASCT